MELKYHLHPSKTMVLKFGILRYLKDGVSGRIWWVMSRFLLVVSNNLTEVCEQQHTIQDTFLWKKFNTIDQRPELLYTIQTYKSCLNQMQQIDGYSMEG